MRQQLDSVLVDFLVAVLVVLLFVYARHAKCVQARDQFF
jgi:hypothetical protein